MPIHDRDTPRSDAILLRAVDPTRRAYEFRLLSEELERESAKLARWIIQHCDHFAGDHACHECFPGEPSTIEGFRCAVHVARSINNAS